MRFKAKQDFFSDELKSQYVEGMSYTVRPGNTLLAGLAAEWKDDGRIEWIDQATPEAQVGGTGMVS